MRTCDTCGKELTITQKHRNCPKCRGDAKRHPCKKCEKLVRGGSVHCTGCLGEIRKGSDNAHWKDGKTHHKKGYVLIRSYGHPRQSNHYVFEHIIVMEKHLGRFLMDGENVHHRNGVKDDNRLENLELWVKPQPSGVRVEDAISWAKEILKRYC